MFFDLDGLLVNTEKMHYQAYKNMCKGRGADLEWSFEKYCSIAHESSTGLQLNIQKELKALSVYPWKELYKDKKQAYLNLLEEGDIELMPGAEKAIAFLQEQGILSCVITHSPKELVDKIKSKLPALSMIPYWITREDYKEPKPAPDGYLLAKGKYAKEGERIIGFEDTLRGWTALNGAGVEGVVISTVLREEVKQELLEQGVRVVSSFYELS